MAGVIRARMHGMNKTRIYKIWVGIIKRTRKGRSTSRNYYDRGIRVCDRWKDFRNFLDDMNYSYQEHCRLFSEKDTQIDRINNDGNYEPSNCKWSTRSENSRNRRMTFARDILFNGKVNSIAGWARETGILEGTLRSRINAKKWAIEKALTTPVDLKMRRVSLSQVQYRQRKEYYTRNGLT